MTDISLTTYPLLIISYLSFAILQESLLYLYHFLSVSSFHLIFFLYLFIYFLWFILFWIICFLTEKSLIGAIFIIWAQLFLNYAHLYLTCTVFSQFIVFFCCSRASKCLRHRHVPCMITLVITAFDH